MKTRFEAGVPHALLQQQDWPTLPLHSWSQFVHDAIPLIDSATSTLQADKTCTRREDGAQSKLKCSVDLLAIYVKRVLDLLARVSGEIEEI